MYQYIGGGAVALAVLLGGAAAMAPALAATGIDPRCATIPVSMVDPAERYRQPASTAELNVDELWRIPPGGTCRVVVADPGPSRTVLSYPDGRVWAEWVGAPRSTVTFHTPLGPASVVIDLPAQAALVLGPGHRAGLMPTFRLPRTPRECLRQLPRVSGRRIVLVFRTPPDAVGVRGDRLAGLRVQRGKRSAIVRFRGVVRAPRALTVIARHGSRLDRYRDDGLVFGGQGVDERIDRLRPIGSTVVDRLEGVEGVRHRVPW